MDVEVVSRLKPGKREMIQDDDEIQAKEKVTYVTA
jgi:hypothetical protein